MTGKKNMQQSCAEAKVRPLKLMDFTLGQSSLIEASAGTGKTYTITNLVLRILLGIGSQKTALSRPLLLDDLLIVTFTNAATADLRKRIFERIREARLAFTQISGHILDTETKGERVLIHGDDELCRMMGKDDEILLQLAKDLLQRQLLRQAILVLTRAERSIDNAAICTIHSFCNRALNQVYTFEAGEAFNVTVTNDLSDEQKEAFYTVWRRLFYKKCSSSELLDIIEKKQPLEFAEELSILNQVRLSQPKKGVLGYLLEHFDTAKLRLSSSSNVEKQLLKAFDQYTLQKQCRLIPFLHALKDFQAKYSHEELSQYFSPEQEKCGPYTEQAGTSSSFAKEPAGIFKALFKSYAALASLEQYAPQDIARLTSVTDIPESKKSPVFAALRQIEATFPEEVTEIEKQLLMIQGSKSFSSFIYKRSSYKDEEKSRALEQKFIEDINSLRTRLQEISRSTTVYIPLIRTLFLILLTRELDQQCKAHRVMGSDEVLRRLDYALNNENKALGNKLAAMLRHRYPLAMIDEFQDTDPIQYSIFSRLYLNEAAVKDKCYCYLIGDPKQSIYAFRGSDINSYIKARQCINKMTRGKGIYTLGTNYRSSADVVHGYNALFSTTLNEQNTNPFKEEDIPFNEVSADKEKIKDQEYFALSDIEKYVDPLSRAEENTKARYGNTYVVNMQEECKTKLQLNKNIAQVTAALVAKVLKAGKIYTPTTGPEGMSIRPGDITILVRTSAENTLIQQALWEANIPSVYFSDKSSVLVEVEDARTSMSQESREMIYLMEAMCDCTDRSKLMSVLSSSLLSFTTEEFLEHLQEDVFEKEVRCLSDSLLIWKQVGFQAAFEHWTDDSLHNVNSRLLQQRYGERFLTNFRHLSEIIQTAHNKQGGVQAQLHWFYELASNIRHLPNAEDAQKRLESEKDQIKIMTIHKSKGLEFPIVFIPFLWNWHKDTGTIKSFFNAVLVYSREKKHKVLDYKPDFSLTGDVTPEQLAKEEQDKEQTRLLYVALTRARYANFMFCGVLSAKQRMHPSALIRMMTQEQEDNVCLKSDFLAQIAQHKEDFTILDGQVCQEYFMYLHNQREERVPEKGIGESGALSVQQQMFTTESQYEQAVRKKLEERGAEDAPAISFVYEDAIAHCYDLISYSSITHSAKVQSDLQADYIDEARDTLLFDRGVMQQTEAHKSDSNLYEVRVPYKEKPLECIEDLFDRDDPRYMTFYMQRLWENGFTYDPLEFSGDGLNEKVEPLALSFPKGAQAGTFLHECLQRIFFSQIKRDGYLTVIRKNVVYHEMETLQYQNFIQDKYLDSAFVERGLTEWLNDIVEAPIIHGRHNCLALADLQMNRWRSEMEFALGNTHIDTRELDILCQDVARDLLPEDMQAIIPTLVLPAKENRGFLTGAIDVTCCFDLNFHVDIMNRYDLKGLLPQECRRRVEARDPLLNQETYNQALEDIRNRYNIQAVQNPKQRRELYQAQKQELLELRNRRREVLGVTFDEQDEEGPLLKYFVLDYKSNVLGTADDSYSAHHLLEAIYAHRYDVQFLIYTLALYRFLKQRKALDPDADYETLKEFYEQNIGGVAYLFIRGMKADYTRTQLSPGVFFTRLDFDYIYRLDAIINNSEEEE